MADTSITRRDMLKGTAVAGAAAAVTAVAPSPAEARGNLPVPPQAVGFLFDSTLCVGCKACVTACKEANGIAFDTPRDQPWLDSSRDIGPKALNVIKMYKDSKGEAKDREADGFAFVKRSCMHCVDPSCVSVCPVTAMSKDPMTGIVSHDPNACIGCRYCVVSCPFGIPRFEYDTPVPKISKCQLCKHLQAKGELPACAESCPTGATLFGPRPALLAEAKRRLALKPGEVDTAIERRKVGSKEATRPRANPKYLDHVYGEHEAGGTQMLMISGVGFDKLGLPTLPERSYASVSETIQHSLYQYLALPAVALAGLVYVVKRNKGGDDEQA